MKALTTAGLTKLIQLIKSSFISVDDTVTTTTVTLADVATSGSYNDLTNKPTIPTESTVSGWGFTKNTGTVTSVNNVQPVNGNVTLADVATTGDYDDLINKPTIPSEVTESTVSGWGFTKNTGTVTSVNNIQPVNGNVTLANVATTGDYDDLINKPTIPSEVTESTVSGWGFTKNTGTVTSVNNVQPVNGNVSLTVPTTLTDLTDTNITSPTNGQSLVYDSTTNKWINGTQESSGVTFRDWRTQCTVTLNITNSNNLEIKSIVIAGVDYLAEAIKNGLDPTGSSTGITISAPQQSEATTFKVTFDTSSQVTGSIDISGSTTTLSATLM